jgi:hypothetical protein
MTKLQSEILRRLQLTTPFEVNASPTLDAMVALIMMRLETEWNVHG